MEQGILNTYQGIYFAYQGINSGIVTVQAPCRMRERTIADPGCLTAAVCAVAGHRITECPASVTVESYDECKERPEGKRRQEPGPVEHGDQVQQGPIPADAGSR